MVSFIAVEAVSPVRRAELLDLDTNLAVETVFTAAPDTTHTIAMNTAAIENVIEAVIASSVDVLERRGVDVRARNVLTQT